MRLKILGAVVFGLLFTAVAPLSQTSAVRSVMFDLSARMSPQAGGAASAAGLNNHPKPKPTSKPTPTPTPPPAATDCILIVPANPLSAQGLATPWQLTQARGNPACHQSDTGVTSFVQGTVIDPATGQLSVFNPLVVDRGTKPAIAPTVPALPANAVVGIWVGYNGGNLTLAGPGAKSCVNGIAGSIFGQVSYCNAPAFFQQANAAIKAGKLTIPDLGTAKDGLPCPTVRDWSVVDQDQSDNVTTTYLLTAKGQTAQDTPENAAKLAGATVSKNASDNGLMTRGLDKALGCTPMMAPDLASPAHGMLTSQGLNELQAAAKQPAPQAVIPTLNPMVLVDGKRSVAKINAFRAGVDQPQITSLSQAFTGPYCRHVINSGLPRVLLDQPLTQALPSPFPDQANSLFTFLAMRAQN